MGLFLCEMCGEKLNDENHKCSVENLTSEILRLKEEARQLFVIRNQLQDGILGMVADSSSLSGDTVAIKKDKIQSLFDLCKQAFGSIERFNTATSFFSAWCAMHGLLTAASRIFHTHFGGKKDLEWLRNKVVDARDRFGYQSLGLSVDQVIGKLKEERIDCLVTGGRTMMLTDELLDEIFGKSSVPRMWSVGVILRVIRTSDGYQVTHGSNTRKVATVKQLVNASCLACHAEGFNGGCQYVKRQLWDILGGDSFVKDLLPTSSPDE